MNRRILKQRTIVVSDKTNTTGTWSYDAIASAEVFNELAANRFGFIPEAGIKSWLTTTGLRCIVINCAAGFLQHFDHVKCCGRKKLVNKTGYKKLYVQTNIIFKNKQGTLFRMPCNLFTGSYISHI
jgi:hypothetical protein